MHHLKRARGEKPLEHRIAADAERIFEILIGTGAIAVQGETETLNAEFGHEEKSWRFRLRVPSEGPGRQLEIAAD